MRECRDVVYETAVSGTVKLQCETSVNRSILEKGRAVFKHEYDLSARVSRDPGIADCGV
jgi:murein endopeptidase